MTLQEWIDNDHRPLISGNTYLVTVVWLGDANTTQIYELRHFVGHWQALDLEVRTEFGSFINTPLNAVDITGADYISLNRLSLVAKQDRV